VGLRQGVKSTRCVWRTPGRSRRVGRTKKCKKKKVEKRGKECNQKSGAVVYLTEIGAMDIDYSHESTGDRRLRDRVGA